MSDLIGKTVTIKEGLDHPSTIEAGDQGRIMVPDVAKWEFLVRFEKNNEQRWIKGEQLEGI